MRSNPIKWCVHMRSIHSNSTTMTSSVQSKLPPFLFGLFEPRKSGKCEPLTCNLHASIKQQLWLYGWMLAHEKDEIGVWKINYQPKKGNMVPSNYSKLTTAYLYLAATYITSTLTYNIEQVCHVKTLKNQTGMVLLAWSSNCSLFFHFPNSFILKTKHSE